MKDLNNLSKEELIALVSMLSQKEEESNKKIKEQEKALQKKDKIIEKKDKIIAKLEAEKHKLNIKLDSLIEKYEQKVQMSKKIAADRYASKSEALPKTAEAINEVEAIIETKPKKERKSPTESFVEVLKDLSSETIVIDYDFEGNNINKELVKDFGKDETYKIEITPLNYKVVKIERPKYKDKDTIYQSVSNDIFPHSPLTPSLAANIITTKYELGVPLYRYSKYMNSFGLMITIQDLSNYVKKAIEVLDPLYRELEKALVNPRVNVLHGDETTLQIVDSEKKNCYMFVYATSFWDDPVYIYKFSETRRIDNTIELLNKFSGYFICDGYTGYDKLPIATEGRIKVQRCWTHMRRYFIDVLKPLSKEEQVKSPAYDVIQKIDRMFRYEHEMIEKMYTSEEILKERNSSKYQKMLDDIDSAISNIKPGPNIILEKAINHYFNDKKELYTFKESGYVDISNNLAERTVKPFVIFRKSFMFCKTKEGAETTSKAFSIVQTARANGVIVELYLKYVLENIAKKPIEELLPWSDKLPSNIKITNK